MLLLWLRMLWLGVDLTTVIPCLGVSQLLIFVSCNVFKTVWLELSPTPPSTHTSLLLGRFSIGCLLNTVPYPRLPISLLSILASVLLMTLQRFGMICLMMYFRPLLSTHSEGSSKPTSLHKHIHPSFCFPWFLSVALTFAMSQVYDYSFLLYVWCA